jgi:hypothetical protein
MPPPMTPKFKTGSDDTAEMSALDQMKMAEIEGLDMFEFKTFEEFDYHMT